MFYNPFKSYGLSVHMAEELKKSFKKPVALFEDEGDRYPNSKNYSKYFRSYVPNANCTEYIDEVFALEELFHSIVDKEYEMIYMKDGKHKFDENIDVSEIYAIALPYDNRYDCEYIFYYYNDDTLNKLHEIYLHESRLGVKEIVISYYGGKKYSIKFAPGAELNKFAYRKLDISYYYRSLPEEISITTLNNETYSYDISSIYNIREMANTILQDTKALEYLVKFYSETLGEEYVNRLSKFR